MAAYLSDYFANGVEDCDRVETVSEVNKVIELLNVYWEQFPGYKDGLCQLLFALASFVLDGNTSPESQRLFLLGIQAILIRPASDERLSQDSETSFFARDAMKALHSLFEKVQPGILKQCIAAGLESEQPDIKICCRVLMALAGH